MNNGRLPTAYNCPRYYGSSHGDRDEPACRTHSRESVVTGEAFAPCLNPEKLPLRQGVLQCITVKEVGLKESYQDLYA